jgi:hypothetical protein
MLAGFARPRRAFCMRPPLDARLILLGIADRNRPLIHEGGKQESSNSLSATDAKNRQATVFVPNCFAAHMAVAVDDGASRVDQDRIGEAARVDRRRELAQRRLRAF